MSPSVASQWREKASGLFSSPGGTGMKLKEAGRSAGLFMGDVAKDAGSSVVEAAERVKGRWALLQQSGHRRSSQESIQERVLSAAASTSILLKRSISDTREKVAVGKMKVEEATKKARQRSKSILSNIERWQKGQASGDVFGAPIEIVVQKQKGPRPIPQIVIKSVDYLIFSGLNSEWIFKSDGDTQVIQRLVSLYNEDWNASLPEDASPCDVAALLKIYLMTLPEPILTFGLYDEIKGARGSPRQLREILKRLPNVNYSTIECLTALLLQISQKSILNKMDAHNLAIELAPAMLWQRERTKFNTGQKPVWYMGRSLGSKSSSQLSERSSAGTLRGGFAYPTYNGNAIDESNHCNNWQGINADWTLSDPLSPSRDSDFSTQIPLDDDTTPVEFAIVEAVQCLIEQHNAIFTDSVDLMWQ